MEKQRKKVTRKRKERLIIPPNISHIKDLIAMATSDQEYKNINNRTLEKILPQLEEIDRMIGMEQLKETILLQILFYIQGLDKDKNYLHTVIMGSPGTGKCMGKDTLLLMYDGSLKKCQDVVVGDELMGDDSTKRNVTSICSGTEDLYKIEQSHAQDYIVNKSHILSLIDDMNNKMDLPLSEYNSRLFGYKVPVLFPHKDVAIPAYIIGYMIANHIIYEEEKLVILSVHSDVLCEYFESLNIFQKRGDNTYSIECHYFEQKYPTIFTDPHIPNDYKVNDSDTLLEFLSGFHDSIANCTSEHNSIISFGNDLILNDIIHICSILNIQYIVNSKKISCSMNENTYSSVFNSITIPNNMNTIRSRIYAFKSKINEYIRSELTISLHEENGTYYGFEIDGNRRFLLSDCTVTHNTTIAKIIGEMYKNMEILAGDTFRIAKREDFVAEYLGQTSIKTKRLLESCKGGVLFIDEVYSLGPGKKDQDSFSKEAIDTLTAFLSENLDFCCIIAGYEDEIKNCFFSVNPGLERRFQWVHRVGEYSVDDLVNIFYKIVEEVAWEVKVSVDECKKLIKDNKNMFKNYGGDIENFVSKCKMCHGRRIISLENPEKYVFTIEDLKEGIKMMKKHRLVEDVKKDLPPPGMYV